jgi:AcrR family transcriptional regulator
MTSSAAGSPPATRRTRQRQATLAEIKSLARQQLAEHGTGAVNLRAIARQMGTASSALYRYFPSHDDLITALCVDAYEAGADAMAAARDQLPPADHAGRWQAVCVAFRLWALSNRADFALIAGTPIPGYRAAQEATGPAAARFMGIPGSVYIAAVAAGAADPGRTQMPADPPTGPLLRDLLSRTGYAPSAQVAAIVITAWASVRGYLGLEIFGSLTQNFPDTDILYQAHIRTIMTGMGFREARGAGQPVDEKGTTAGRLPGQ